MRSSRRRLSICTAFCLGHLPLPAMRPSWCVHPRLRRLFVSDGRPSWLEPRKAGSGPSRNRARHASIFFSPSTRSSMQGAEALVIYAFNASIHQQKKKSQMSERRRCQDYILRLVLFRMAPPLGRPVSTESHLIRPGRTQKPAHLRRLRGPNGKKSESHEYPK